MCFLRIVCLHCLALLLVLLHGAVEPGPAWAAEFPQMRVQTVSGLALDLPKDFSDGISIVVIAYDQDQQMQADSWVPFLDGVTAADASARYYILPVLPAGLSFVRGMVEGVIRTTEKVPEQLDRTIFLFTNVDEFQASLGISGTSAVHVLVLDNKGEVVAVAFGEFTPAVAEIVKDGLATLGCCEISNFLGGEQPIEGIEQFRRTNSCHGGNCRHANS